MALMAIGVTIVLALLGNIAVVCYWGGKVDGKIDGMDKDVREVKEDVKSIWKKIDDHGNRITALETHHG